MILLTLRLLKIYLRDKAAVFFSLLSSFIIVGLYILFLGDNFTTSFQNIENAHLLMDQWVMAGLLATTSVSTTIAVFSIMVNDSYTHISKDFYCTPVKKRVFIGGYLLAGFVVGMSLSVVTLVFTQIYILINGGTMFSFSTYCQILCVLFFNVLLNTSMMFFLSTFFQTNHAFSTASTIVGTLIGFLTGIYVPVGVLPSMVQWIVKLFPTSHGAALLRQVMMENTMNQALVHVPETMIIEMKNILGVTFELNQFTFTVLTHYLYMIFFTLLFCVGVFIQLKRKKS